MKGDLTSSDALDLGMIADRTLRFSPAQMVAIAAGLHVLLWSLVPALLYAAPPLDVVEGYVHGPYWVLSTLKHPALPSWVLEVSRQLTGAVGWPAYLIAQLCIAATLALVYMLGRDLMDPARAAAGTLLLSGVVYFAWPSIEFNHNVALMPLWAGLFLCLWRAVESRKAIYWMATAAVAAAMMHTKLSSGVAFVAAALWLLSDAKGRRALTRPAPWLAAMLFVALVVPLVLSLRASNFAPLAYAASRAEAAANSGPLVFVAAQALALVGLLLLIGAADVVVRRSDLMTATQQTAAPWPDRGLRYLLFASALPLLLVVLLATVSGAGLRSSWGAAMLSFSGLLAVALAGPRFGLAHVRPIFWGSIGLLVITPVLFGVAHQTRGAFDLRPARAHWPQAEISRAMRRLWQDETGRPLRYVAGPFWGAGLAALAGRDMPLVIVDGDLTAAPGVTFAALQRDGVLIVETGEAAATAQALAGVGAVSKSGETKFPVAGARRGQSVTFRWAIIAPVRP